MSTPPPPQPEKDTRRAAVEAFLRRPNRLRCDDGSWIDYRFEQQPDGSFLQVPEPQPPATDQPLLYRRVAVRRRLMLVLSALPADFFRRLVDDRGLSILISASPRGLWNGPPDEIDAGAHGSHAVRGLDLLGDLDTYRGPGSWLIKLGRVVIELAPPQAFAGIVIHECCHVYIGHEGDDGKDDDNAIQSREDEAVALACRLGFHQETTAYLDFLAETFGHTGIMGRLPIPHARPARSLT